MNTCATITYFATHHIETARLRMLIFKWSKAYTIGVTAKRIIMLES